jgi:hypothetical protein
MLPHVDGLSDQAAALGPEIAEELRIATRRRRIAARIATYCPCSHAAIVRRDSETIGHQAKRWAR